MDHKIRLLNRRIVFLLLSLSLIKKLTLHMQNMTYYKETWTLSPAEALIYREHQMGQVCLQLRGAGESPSQQHQMERQHWIAILGLVIEIWHLINILFFSFRLEKYTTNRQQFLVYFSSVIDKKYLRGNIAEMD